MKKCVAFVVSITAVVLTATSASAQQAPVNLRSDSSFALLAGTTVTVTGGGTITGNVGIFPGTAYVAGVPPVTVNGTVYAGGPVAAQAEADLSTAFNDAAGRSLAPITIAGNIGGQTLAPGLYKSTSSLAISSGNLTLDAGGNANAVWIFQIASTLTTTSGRQVILAGGANPANIFWQVGTSATIGTTSVFQGNILAGVSISMLTGSTLSGRALAIGGAVTVDTGGGSSATVPVAPTAPTVTSTVPSNGATGISATSKITATFSTTMNPSTITASSFTLTQAGGPVSGAVTYSGTTATFTPNSSLGSLQTYTGTITTQATDQSGNPLAGNYIWSFTTGSGTVANPPTVISTAPAAGATGVSAAGKLTATFSTAMDPTTITASTFTLLQGGTTVPGVVTYSGTTATFSPSTSLIPNASFNATITTGAKDLSGNALAANYAWTFATGAGVDTTPPVVTSTVPVSGAQSVPVGTALTATFSKPMDPLTITTNTFTLQTGSTAVAGTVTYNGTTATFTPLGTLSFSTTYTATVTNGARDLSGNALASNFVWNFTMAAVVNPPPVLTLNGTVNDATYKTPVTPGSIAAVFGTNMSNGQGSSAEPTPMPTTLAQSSFNVGGVAAPLYFVSPTQVNLQVPWELAGQSQTSIVDTVGGNASNTQTVPLAPFSPGIFTIDLSGSGQGAILVSGTTNLASPGTPALRSGYISIYCTGLGPVSNQPATGVAAGSNPLSYTATLPTVSIGGVNAVVSYAGLAPGFAGLYQVNAIVPAAATPGNAIPVVLTIGNVASNGVTIAVQ